MDDIAIVIIGCAMSGIVILSSMTLLYYYVKLGAKFERKLLKIVKKE